MGLVIKRHQGREYLYAVANRDHYFVCRKDDERNVHLDNLRKATRKIDHDFDHRLGEYLTNLWEFARLMPEGEGSKYAADRIKELRAALDGVDTKKDG